MNNTPAHAQHFPLPTELGGGAIRVLAVEGEPWFVATDIGTYLGYAEPHKVAARHCKGGMVHPILTEGGTQVMTIIPERDLYRLILRSKLPSAERFEEWVVGAVLPTIRKTGAYVAGEEKLDPTTEDGFLALQKLYTETLAAKLKAAEDKLATAQPKADAFDNFQAAPGSTCIRDAAKSLGVQPRKFLKPWLIANGWLTGKGDMPTIDAIHRGLMAVFVSTCNGFVQQGAHLTPKGIAHLGDLKARGLLVLRA